MSKSIVSLKVLIIKLTSAQCLKPMASVNPNLSLFVCNSKFITTWRAIRQLIFKLFRDRRKHRPTKKILFLKQYLHSYVLNLHLHKMYYSSKTPFFNEFAFKQKVRTLRKPSLRYFYKIFEIYFIKCICVYQIYNLNKK